MKQFVFGFCAGLLLTFGPVRPAAAQEWGHGGPGPKGAGEDTHMEWQWPKRQIGRSHEKLEPLYSSPKSVGWWHKSPAPMGVGADTHMLWQWSTWRMPHIGRAHQERLEPLYTSPKSVGWWHKTPAPMGAGSDNSGARWLPR